MIRNIIICIVSTLIIVIAIYLIFFNNKDNIKFNNTSGDEINTTNDIRINIVINGTNFEATLLDNETTKDFLKLLPMTITMQDHLNNEKYYDLPTSLTTNTYNPSKINIGDIMLFGNNTLVIFYESFNTNYSYTKIGNINNYSDLKSLLGNGNVTATFEYPK